MPDNISYYEVEESLNDFASIARTSGHISSLAYTFPNPLPQGAKYRVTGTTATLQTIPSEILPLTTTQPGTTAWVKTFGGTDRDECGPVAIMADGSILVAGFFRNTVDFTGGNNTVPNATTLTARGNFDMFLAKFDASGTLLWVKQFGKSGGVSTINPTCIAVDTDGSFLVGGFYARTTNFGGPDRASIRNDDTQAGFVAKYAAGGTWLWDSTIVSAFDNQVNGVAVDSNHNFFATGFFKGNGDPNTVPPGDGVVAIAGTNLIEYGLPSTFLAKWRGTDGLGLGSKTFTPNGGYDAGLGMAIDRRNDNVVIVGYYAQFINFATPWGDDNHPGGFVAVFDKNMNHLRSKQIASFNSNNNSKIGKAGSVVVDSAGRIIIGGIFTGGLTDLDLGVVQITGNGALPGPEPFVAVYNADLTFVWSWHTTGADGIYEMAVSSVAVDANDDILFSGFFRAKASPPLNFGSKTYANNSNFADGFVAKLSKGGAPVWSQALGGTGSDSATFIAARGTSIIVTGGFSGTASFDGTSLQNGGTHDPAKVKVSKGNIDAYLMKINQ